MVNVERTGSREGDLIYSGWHRTIGDEFYMMNLDCIEFRTKRGIVAFIETAIFDPEKNTRDHLLEQKKAEIDVLWELYRRTRIKTFLVLHNLPLLTFWIYSFSFANSKPDFWRAMNRMEYAAFLRSL